MFKFVLLALLVTGANASFWQSCNLPGVVTPDAIESEACSGNRCTVTRGETLFADAFFTPTAAHNELLATATAYHTLLPGGLNISLAPHDNACNALFDPNTRAPVSCPTIPGVRTLWVLQLTVSTVPALNNVRVRFSLTDSGTQVGCVDVFANIA